MLADLKISKVLFLDIETVPIKYNFEELSKEFQKLWEEKTLWQRNEEFTATEFYKKKAGMMAEFAKVVCISVGYLFSEKGENHFRIKSFYADEEKELLSDFILLLNKEFNTKLPPTGALLGRVYADMLVRALEKAGRDLNHSTFQKAVESLEYKDVFMDLPVKFGENDHVSTEGLIISQIVDGNWKELTRK